MQSFPRDVNTSLRLLRLSCVMTFDLYHCRLTASHCSLVSLCVDVYTTVLVLDTPNSFKNHTGLLPTYRVQYSTSTPYEVLAILYCTVLSLTHDKYLARTHFVVIS